MKRAASILLSLMIALAPASAQSDNSSDDRTVTFAPGDPEMTAATAQALASLDEFLALSEAPPPGTDNLQVEGQGA